MKQPTETDHFNAIVRDAGVGLLIVGMVASVFAFPLWLMGYV